MIIVEPNRAELSALASDLRRLAHFSKRAMRDVVLEQAALLQAELVRSVPPANRAKTRAQIRKQLALHTMAYNSRGWWDERSKKVGKGSILWVYAAPWLLAGIDRTLDLRSESLSTVIRAIRDRQNAGRQRSRVGVGRRGVQKVVLLNKLLITKAQRLEILRLLTERIGRLKASFAAGWRHLNPRRRLPQWIAKHLTRNNAGKAVFHLTDDRPFVELHSWATGNAHPATARAIRTAIERRRRFVAANIERRLRGWKHSKIEFRVRPGGRAFR